MSTPIMLLETIPRKALAEFDVSAVSFTHVTRPGLLDTSHALLGSTLSRFPSGKDTVQSHLLPALVTPSATFYIIFTAACFHWSSVSEGISASGQFPLC